MERTRPRPLPSGALDPGAALVFAILLVASGSFVLLLPGGALAPNLGLLAVAVYNGLYTPLKRRTAYALFAGAVAGALPPLMGWCMAGGDPLAPAILALTAFSYLWQVPHALLLMLRDKAELARAGIPTLAEDFSEAQLRRIAASWLIATGAIPLLLPLFGVALPGAVYAVFACLAGIVVLRALRLYAGRSRQMPVGAVAAYAALVLAILAAERLLGI
jgi:protoheme IX farnesyltransferase